MTSLPQATLAVALVLGSLPSAQPAPDFSGTWTIDLERSESPHQGTAFEPPTYVITQSADAVLIETRRGSARGERRYPFAARGARASDAPRAWFEGPTLVTEGARLVQGQTVTVRESRTLDATGTEMTLQTVVIVQHGYTFRGGQNYGAATDVYRKTAPPPSRVSASSRRRPAPAPPPA
jgi:hypothetical protein